MSSLRRLIVGGSAVPEALLKGYDRYGVDVIQAWGMTETTSLATVCALPPDLAAAPTAAEDTWRTMQGAPIPFVEIRARGESGMVPWDGETVGELEMRGPTVAKAYYNAPEDVSGFTDDQWFRTGDIVTISPQGYIHVRDRTKDLIKSGGEWISSVALENALMGHPCVAEAAVIAVSDPDWASGL